MGREEIFEAQGLLNSIVEQACALLRGRGGGMYLYDRARKEAVCVVSYNTPKDYRGVRLRPGEGAAGRVIQSGEPLIINDYRNWEGRAEVFEEDRPFTAVVSAPLKWEGEVRGVIHVLDDAPGRTFTEADLNLLLVFADQAAIALENARLYREEQRRRRELEALAKISRTLSRSLDLEEVLSIALEEMLQVSGMEKGGIYLLDEERGELDIMVHRGGVAEIIEQLKTYKLGHGLTGKAAAERRVIVCPDVLEEFPHLRELAERSGVRSQISLPLISKGRLFGVLNLNKAEVYTPPEEELRLLMLAAEQIALAIENAKLYRRERQRARWEAALGAIGHALSRTLEPQKLLEVALDELLEALGLDIGGVYLLEGEEFHLVVQRGLSPEFARAAARNPKDHYILGRVIRSREPLEVEQFSSPAAREEGLKYAAYTPLIVRNEPQGVLIVADRTERRLRPEELKRLKEFDEELLESTPIGIVRLDRDGRIIYENPAMRRVLGVPEGEEPKTLGRKITELPNIMSAGLVERLEGLLAGRGFRDLRTPFTSLYGREVVLAVEGVPFSDAAGRPDGAMLLVRDITALEAAERFRERLIEVANEVLGSHDTERIIRRVAEAIVELSPFQRAAVSLYDLTAEEPLATPVMRIYSAGLTKEEEERLISQGGLRPEYRRAAFSEEFRLSRSYYVPHDRLPWGKGEGVPGRVSLDGWHPDDFLFIPLRTERGIIGHISVDDPRLPRAVDRTVLGPLETFAGLAALAVERAARMEELREQKERLRGIYRFSHRLVSEAELPDLFQRALEMLEREFNYDYATIQLLQGEELEVVAERLRASWEGSFLGKRIPLGQGLCGWAAAHRRPILVDDGSQDPRFIPSFKGIRSEVVAPLIFGEELLGVIDVESRRERAFSPDDEELLGAIAAQLAVAISEIHAREELRELSIRDPLTGLYNRRHLGEAVARELERGRRYGHSLALLMIDLDNFREVNNRYGHLKGDEVLREIAELLVRNVRAADMVFRYGGDEFLILMPETDSEAGEAIARLKRAVEEWNEQSGLDCRVGISIGATSWSPGEERGVEEVLAEADRWMYREKQGE